MRKRRKGNPMLGKTMGIAALIVVCLLPLLGYLGAFKVGKSSYTQMTMVTMPPPPPRPKLVGPKKSKPAETHRRGIARAGGHARPLAVHVAVANTPASSTANPGDTTVENGTSTAIGQAPTPPATAPAPPAPVPAPAPTPTPPAPSPAPTPAPAPDVAAKVIDASAVQPEIPDDLRGGDMTWHPFRALFTIQPDGSDDVKLLESTGNAELDAAAMQAAQHWRFTPGTQSGKPVTSYLRLYIEFQVE
jgi:TonB family protein